MSRLWQLPPFLALTAPQFLHWKFAACMFGTPFRKPTAMHSTDCPFNPGFAALQQDCFWNREQQRYSCGAAWGSHVRLCDELPASVGAEYSSGLCKAWAEMLLSWQAELQRPPPLLGTTSERAPRAAAAAPQPNPTAHAAREEENDACRAGLRQAARACLGRPALLALGNKLAHALQPFMPQLHSLLDAVGLTDPQLPAGLADELTSALAAAVSLPAVEARRSHRSCPWAAGLLLHLAQQAEDADVDAARWLLDGAPVGISAMIPPTGYFPSDQDASQEELWALQSAAKNHASFYRAVDGRRPGEDVIQTMISVGLVEVFEDERAAEAALGSPLVVSPLGTLTKTVNGRLRHRLISDYRQPNRAARRSQRLVLPRPTDHASDVVELGPGSWTLVLDFRDAYHAVPLLESERKFHCARLPSGSIASWRVLGFGGKEFPLIFCRVASLLARLTQATVGLEHARLQLYLDDPALTVRGPEPAARARAALALGLWHGLRVPLAWSKGQWTQSSHSWIGVQFSPQPAKDVCDMFLPEAFLSKLHADLQPLTADAGHVAVQTARQAVGRCSRTAQVASMATPYAAAMWAALGAALQHPREAPPGRVAIARFKVPARWFLALTEQRSVPLRRRLWRGFPAPPTSAVLREVRTDASPHGGGFVLFEDNTPVAWCHQAWSTATMDLLDTTQESSSQAVLETAAALLAVHGALQHWGSSEPWWIRSDSVAALAALQRGAATGRINALAREISLLKATTDALFWATHLRGKANVLADAISRLADPTPAAVPAALLTVQRMKLPDLPALLRLHRELIAAPTQPHTAA